MKNSVCLIVEGTYPYVSGGVSAWTHSLVKELAEIPFHIYHIGSFPNPGRKPHYALPPNVSGMMEVFIHAVTLKQIGHDPYPRTTWRLVADFHERLKAGDLSGFGPLMAVLSPNGKWPDSKDILNAKGAWDILIDAYRRRCPGQSFIDYFWTWRFIHLPLIKVLANLPPPFGIYHATSTGYAGLAAAAAAIKHRRPAILTEHGLYTVERRLEIDRADWIHSPEEDGTDVSGDGNYFKELWIRFFDSLARLAYHAADRVISLSTQSRRMQLEMGAEPSKTTIIPNGVDMATLAAVKRQSGKPVSVAFVGRVVAVKDVRRFIKACRIVADAVPEATFTIYGPADEEPEYGDICRHLISALELDERLRLAGEKPVTEILAKSDIVVLTSHSEAQPLALLEAMAAGLPVVAPDVGACADLILGGENAEDRSLGPAGIVTRPGRMEETAEALMALCRSASERDRLGENGKKRVSRFYRLETLIAGYRSLYRNLLGGG